MPNSTALEKGGKKLKSCDLMPCKAPLSLRCEWGDCSKLFHSMLQFRKHIETHLWEVFDTLKSEQDPSTLENIACDWCECGHEVGRGFPELVRHVYFHAFHSRLKNVGAYIAKMKEAPDCTLDSSSRNLIPELPDSLTCAWDKCGTVYDDPSVFYEHADSHVEEVVSKQKAENSGKLANNIRCLWEGCDLVVKNKHRLRDHIRSHTQERIAACPVCGALFASNTKLLDHLLRQKDLSSDGFQCSHCSKMFTTERLLRDHMRHHVNHYKCPQCEMTCPTPSTLRSHINHRHNQERPFKCDTCQKTFKQASDLRRHMETHAQIKFYCHVEGCKYGCSNYKLLLSHFKVEHQGEEKARYQCHLCGEDYVRGYLLTTHLKKKHQFQWPSGHHRFRYKLNSDGFYRLQTLRYESLELTEQLLARDMSSKAASADDKARDKGAKRGRPLMTPGKKKKAVDSYSYNLHMLGEVASKQSCVDPQPSMGLISIEPTDIMNRSGSTPVVPGDDNYPEVYSSQTSDPQHRPPNPRRKLNMDISPSRKGKGAQSKGLQSKASKGNQGTCGLKGTSIRKRQSPRKRKLSAVIEDLSAEKLPGSKDSMQVVNAAVVNTHADAVICEDSTGSTIEARPLQSGVDLTWHSRSSQSLEFVLPPEFSNCEVVTVVDKCSGEETVIPLTDTPVLVYGADCHHRKQRTPVKVIAPEAL